jgi:hypothetical protein
MKILRYILTSMYNGILNTFTAIYVLPTHKLKELLSMTIEREPHLMKLKDLK